MEAPRSIGVLAACAALVMAAATMPRVTHAAPLEPGDPMPPLRAERLSGRKITLPDSVRGANTLLVMGFTYESRHDVEAWVARFRHEFAAESSVRWFEIPIIGGAGRLARPFIDGGMRRGTPRELHDQVITLYHDSGAWKQRMDCVDANVAYPLLIDRVGTVVWRGRGPLGEAAYRELAAKLRELPR